MERESTEGGSIVKAGHGGHRAEMDDVSAGLDAISRLDEKGMRQRWRTLMGRPIPLGLGRSLTSRILAYQLQAQRFGDLDRASRQALAQAVRMHDQVDGGRDDAEVPGAAVQSAAPADRANVKAGSSLRPGTMLAREHAGVLHRVMVMEDGFGWNGKTYDSLSKVAFAITGTKWNGPRFFGLREKGADGRKKSIEKAAGQGCKKALLPVDGSTVLLDGRTSP
jgi:hypothetical protein